MLEPTYDPIILCCCGISLHDNPTARKLHEDYWHSTMYPAIYSNAQQDK